MIFQGGSGPPVPPLDPHLMSTYRVSLAFLVLQVGSTDMIYLEEGGLPGYITVTLDSLILDSCHGNNCEVEIFVSSNSSHLPR